MWLAATGSIYLFKPQIDARLDEPYDHLAISAPRTRPSALVAAALRSQPGTVLNAYELPRRDMGDSARSMSRRCCGSNSNALRRHALMIIEKVSA